MTDIPLMSAPPTFPQLGDSGDTFNGRAFDAFDYLAGLGPELNAFAAAINTYAALLFTGTSTTSNTIAASGTKNFTIQTGRAFTQGQPISAARTSSPGNSMWGTVLSYDSSTGALSITVGGSNGSGSGITDWSIGLLPDSAALAKAGGTMTGLLTLAAALGVLLTPGSDPASPSNGQLWAPASGAFKGRIGGTTYSLVLDTLAQTLSNKTLIGYKETEYTITDGAAFEIDPANGSIQTVVLGASRTPKATNMQNGQNVLLAVDDGSAYSLTWTDTTFGPSGVKWIDGTAPTLATSGLTWITLWKKGGQVYGSAAGATA